MTPNLMPGRDREVSVTEVPVPLTPGALETYFLGREVYRRTSYIVTRHGDEAAVLRVKKESDLPLFSPVVTVEVLAGPRECALVQAPEVDTANPTQMAWAAREKAPSARCVIVQGRYMHISFILDPAPVMIRVLDVIPPEPGKLLHQVQRILEVSEGLPPVELVPDFVDLRELARLHPADAYLLPCRGSGVVPEHGTVAYLDKRPPHEEWLLIGCARSRAIHQWFYGQEPRYVEMCPRIHAGQTATPTLTKCCLLEQEVRQEDMVVTVPWGATLEEIRAGLEAAVEIAGSACPAV